ncbi:hypothetical protein HYU19_00365 [Candidatus Woesearchaeota archaeon]|nr:hypothetical protein [Candidatus Woesearchaeota archaeon]
MKRTALFTLLALLAILLVPAGKAQGCIAPLDWMEIGTSVQFCGGEYYLPHGMTVSGDDISITCLGTVLRGDRSGTAITAANRKNISITGCTIEGYVTGFYFNNVGEYDISSNTLDVINNYDVHLPSTVESPDGQPMAEEGDAISALDNSSPAVQVVEEEQHNQPPLPSSLPEIDSSSAAAMIDDALIPQDSIVQAAIRKTYQAMEDSIEITTEIGPLPGTYIVYEIIPKQVASHASEVSFSDTGFLTAIDDPVKMIVGVDLGHGFSFSYNMPKPGAVGIPPMTIVTNEDPASALQRYNLEQNNSRDRILYLLAILFFILCYHYEKKIDAVKRKWYG